MGAAGVEYSNAGSVLPSPGQRHDGKAGAGGGVTTFLTLSYILFVQPVVMATEGIAFAFIAHSLLRLAQGRVREVHWLFHLFSLLFLARYIFITL